MDNTALITQKKTYNNKLCNVVIIVCLSLITLSFWGVGNILSYGYTLSLFLIINSFFEKKLRYYNILIFHFYLLVALLIFSIQYYNLPLYEGLSGPEGGIGTDDIRYYEILADIPLRVSSTAGWITEYPFTNFIKFLYIFRITSPLNIIIFNILGTTFLPALTYIVSICLFHNPKTAKLSGVVILLCPFVWSNGLIIMRDIWTVSLTLCTIVFVIKEKYLLSLFPAILLAYIRFGSIFFLIVIIIVIFKYRYFNQSKRKKILFWSILGCSLILLYISLPLIVKLSSGKLEDSFFRASFVEALIRDDAEGVITKIAQLPPLIRTPLLFLFFYFTPFLKFRFYTLGVFNIRAILDTILTSIWLLIIWRPIFKYIYSSIYSDKKKLLTIISILLAFFLSIISLQVRHKVIMMPFLAIMAAEGLSQPKTKFDQLFSLSAVLIAIFEIIYALK